MAIAPKYDPYEDERVAPNLDAPNKKGKLALGGAEKLACRSINVMGYVLAVLGGTASVLSRMGKI